VITGDPAVTGASGTATIGTRIAASDVHHTRRWSFAAAPAIECTAGTSIADASTDGIIDRSSAIDITIGIGDPVAEFATQSESAAGGWLAQTAAE